jgi:hypothetical protein
MNVFQKVSDAATNVEHLPIGISSSKALITLTIPFHPVAKCFPLFSKGPQFDALVDDIRQRGQHTDIVLYEGKILIGRRIYLACLAAGVTPRFCAYKGSDPLGDVISSNTTRHLSQRQRAIVAARLVTLKLGANQYSKGVPIGTCAKRLAVSRRHVARARYIIRHGVPALVKAVEDNRISLHLLCKSRTCRRTSSSSN